MKNKIVILDFDGTLTLADQEAKPFLINFKKDIANLLNKKDIDEEWRKAEREILQNPDKYGWEYKGKIVAPPNADDYILATVIAKFLLDKGGVLMDINERDDILRQIFQHNYSKSGIVFKKGAKEILEVLIQKIPVFIVTNSNSDAVANKIEQLNPQGKEQIKLFGDAQKYSIDSGFDVVPEAITINGLKRAIYLRRKKYFDVLNQIWNTTFAKPQQTLVIGDIFELDLALPAILNCNIFLVTNSNTPSCEKEAVSHLFKGYVSKDIKDILKIID
jgi:phosphoglycolate phosphatase-like HAD superfamily hydrolase